MFGHIRSARTLTMMLGALVLLSACGGASAQTAATTTPVVATLSPQTTPSPTSTRAPSPTATVAASPTVSAAATASVAASGSSQSLIAAGKVVYQTAGGDGCQSCHGPDAKGLTKDGNTAPNIRTATEQKLRDALRGGVPLMSNLKLTDAQIEAVLAYLAYLDQQ